MSKSDQDEYLKLYNAYAGCQGFSDVFGIYKTNAFSTSVELKLPDSIILAVQIQITI